MKKKTRSAQSELMDEIVSDAISSSIDTLSAQSNELNTFSSDESNASAQFSSPAQSSSTHIISSIHFDVPGEPVAKGRARSYKRGNFIQHVTPEKTVLYENLIKMIVLEAMNGAKPITGAISLRIQAHFGIAASWSKKKKEMAITGQLKATKKPDADNIAKIVGDALNGVAFADDSAVTHLVVTKAYSHHPRIEVQIDALEEQSA